MTSCQIHYLFENLLPLTGLYFFYGISLWWMNEFVAFYLWNLWESLVGYFDGIVDGLYIFFVHMYWQTVFVFLTSGRIFLDGKWMHLLTFIAEPVWLLVQYDDL